MEYFYIAVIILFIIYIIIYIMISFNDDSELKNTIYMDDEYDKATSIGNDLTKFLKKNNFIKNEINDIDDVKIVNRYSKLNLNQRKKLSSNVIIELECLLKNKVDMVTFKLMIEKINKFLSE